MSNYLTDEEVYLLLQEYNSGEMSEAATSNS